jgi:hypothetical protein
LNSIGSSRKKKGKPRSTLFGFLKLQRRKTRKIRTSLPLAAGHRGRRRRGGERLEGSPEGRVKEGRGWGLSPPRAVSTGKSRGSFFLERQEDEGDVLLGLAHSVATTRDDVVDDQRTTKRIGGIRNQFSLFK